MGEQNPIPSPSTGKLSSDVERLVDRIFEQLLASCPSIQYWTEKQIATAKQQWILGFAENNIKTLEQVRLGMRELRAKTDDFVPSIGKFIAWCQEAKLTAQGLPSEDELIKRVKQYASYHGGDNEHEFQFKSDLEYDLVYWLYCQNHAHQWTIDELQKRVKKLLGETAEKLTQGTYQPRKCKALPPKVSFVDPASQKAINLAGVKSCKAILRGEA